MNYRIETEIRTGMIRNGAISANRRSLPKWAKDEQLYNCENYYHSMFETRKNRVRKSLAEVLRKMAEHLDPTSMELKYSA